jgi:sporulation protein YlmC with PRC-barrel domain
MDLPLDVDVHCTDGPAGKTTTVILNPVTNEVTHVSVRYKGDEYLVPLNLIEDSSPTKLQLNIPIEKMTALDPFVRVQFMDYSDADSERDLQMISSEESVTYWPYSTFEEGYYETYASVEQIPHDQLAIHRGAQVYASDGHIGRIDEFIINPDNSHITHIVMQRGHLWGKKSVAIPIGQIDRIEIDTVYLKLDKEAVRALPTVPIRR